MDDYKSLEEQIVRESINKEIETKPGDHSALNDSQQQQRGSVILKTLTAVETENYRQLILLADLLDDEEADRVAAAITEARRYGQSLDPILDWVTARCAVNKAGHGKSRVTTAIEGLTHSSFTVQQPKEKRSVFGNRTTEGEHK